MSGVEYSWSIEKKFPPEKARFKILTPEEAKPIQEQLKSLGGASGVPKTTLATLEANFLLSHGFFYEAREILAEAVTADPDEPAIHLLLGETYKKTGLKSLALDEYGEAQFLSRIYQ